jgi:PAS domain S-box-containing protein
MPNLLPRISTPHSKGGLLLGLATLALVQVFSGAMAYRNTRRLREDAAWVARTHEVLEALQDSLVTMLNAETGQRGYLLTNDPGYLQPYSAAVGRARAKIRRVKALVADDALETHSFEVLETLYEAKFQELDRTIQLQEKDPALARNLVRTHLGRDLMTSIRERVEEIGRDEHALLALREGTSRHSYRVAVGFGALFALLGLAMTAGFLAKLLNHLQDRARHEESLELQRRWLAVTLNSIGDGLIATDQAARVTLVNPSAGKMTGWDPEEAIGQPLAGILPIIDDATGQPLVNPAGRVLAEGIERDLGHHTLLVKKDGSTLPIEDSAAPIVDGEGRVVGMVLVFHDITERRAAEAEKVVREARLQEARNLETLVVLAGGVAHDFNNLLTSILGNANLVSMTLGPEGRTANYLGAIETAALRAADLTGQLLAYAGKGKVMALEEDLNHLVKEVIGSLPSVLTRRAALRCALCDSLPLVLGDATQLAQVVANLVTNAEEACPEGGTGSITLETGEEELDEAGLQGWPWILPVLPGLYATLAVRDPGSGMAPEILTRAFEPFYTTKFAGRGLGLAAVAGILRNHWGGLWVRTEPGRGSTFKVFLPALPGPRLARSARPDAGSVMGG